MDSSEEVIPNASPLISLGKIQKLDLLSIIYQRIWVPSAVWEEIKAGPDGPSLVQNLEQMANVTVVATPPPSDDLLNWNLGKGESSVIALALARPPAELILDDRAAARCANFHALKVRGTLGLLLLAKESGALQEIKSSLLALTENGFWISDALLKKVLLSAREK